MAGRLPPRLRLSGPAISRIPLRLLRRLRGVETGSSPLGRYATGLRPPSLRSGHSPLCAASSIASKLAASESRRITMLRIVRVPKAGLATRADCLPSGSLRDGSLALVRSASLRSQLRGLRPPCFAGLGDLRSHWMDLASQDQGS